MKNSTQLSKRILAFFLWLVLLFPSLLNLVHHCEIHAHLECNEQKAHLHQFNNDCEICDYNLLNLNYDLRNIKNFEQPQIFTTLNAFYTPLQFHSFLQKSIQLRAPPMIS